MLYKLAPVAAAGAAALLLASCSAQSQTAPAPPPAQVSVAVPIKQTVVEWQEFPGRFEAPERVEVRARAGGFLQSAHFKEGAFVRKGQLLFTLDPRPAQAQLAAARAQADLARRELQRAEELLKAQAISQEEYENRKATYAVAEAAVRARALDLEFTRVTAPVSGVVSDRKVDPGNVISGGSSQADVLTTVVSVTPIHFVFDASESQLLERLRRPGPYPGAAAGRDRAPLDRPRRLPRQRRRWPLGRGAHARGDRQPRRLPAARHVRPRPRRDRRRLRGPPGARHRHRHRRRP